MSVKQRTGELSEIGLLCSERQNVAPVQGLPQSSSSRKQIFEISMLITLAIYQFCRLLCSTVKVHCALHFPRTPPLC